MCEVFGEGPLACPKWLTELLTGKTLAQAFELWRCVSQKIDHFGDI